MSVDDELGILEECIVELKGMAARCTPPFSTLAFGDRTRFNLLTHEIRDVIADVTGVENASNMLDATIEAAAKTFTSLPTESHLKDLVSILDSVRRRLQRTRSQSDLHNFSIELWRNLHPRVVNVAESRFKAGHFADAVEAAMKEVNSIVKTIVQRRGSDGDGTALMRKTFTTSDPLITIADLATDSGRSIQEGYQNLFAGAMLALRNPKAHQNLEISKADAIHSLFLASMLLNKLDHVHVEF